MNVRTSGSGPDVVLIHGIPGSSATWSAVTPLLAPTCRVWVPDLLGFGASPRPQAADALAPPAQAEALAAAIDAERMVLVGHDYGGPVALAFAAAHPERVAGVLLAATNAFPDTPIPFPLSAMLLPVVGGLAERALFSRPSLRLMLRRGVGGANGGGRPDPETALGDDRQVRAIAAIFGPSLRHLRERYEPVELALRGLACPVEVVWGERDPFFSLEQAHRTAAAAPGSPQPVVLQGAGHFLPEERPAELAAAVRGLLTR